MFNKIPKTSANEFNNLKRESSELIFKIIKKKKVQFKRLHDDIRKNIYKTFFVLKQKYKQLSTVLFGKKIPFSQRHKGIICESKVTRLSISILVSQKRIKDWIHMYLKIIRNDKST